MYYIVMVIILIIILLFIYTIFFTSNEDASYTLQIKIFRAFLTLVTWVLFTPIIEILISIFNCKNGTHKIDTDFDCFTGLHICYIVLSIIFIILIVLIVLLSSFLYNNTQPSEEDALASSNEIINIVLLFYRLVLGIFSTFVSSVMCSYIIDNRKLDYSINLYICEHITYISLLSIPSLLQYLCIHILGFFSLQLFLGKFLYLHNDDYRYIRTLNYYINWDPCYYWSGL